MPLDSHINQLKADSPLGKPSEYAQSYQPDLLFSMPRLPKRQEINIPDSLPFHGADVWNAYEVSWLNNKGKPLVATMTATVPCESSHIFESKSLKLYLNSFNNSPFDSLEHVQQTISIDLSTATRSTVTVSLQPLADFQEKIVATLPGHNIDHLDITTNCYLNNPSFLTTEQTVITEILNSDLLKSNCLVTNQPDWGSVYIKYKGHKINHEGLLKYIISLRNHNEFHEQCVERIFMDIMQQCQPNRLTVYARYTRRGGIDINPLRTTEATFNIDNTRLARQ